MFGAFSFGNAEFASIPSTEQTENQEEVIVFAPGKIEDGDNGSYF